MRQQQLRQRRLRAPNIPTDEEGNLIQDKRYFISAEQRQRCRVGSFHKKPHADGTPITGTYTQYCYGDTPDNQDVAVK